MSSLRVPKWYLVVIGAVAIRRELQRQASRRALQPRDLPLRLRSQGPLLRLVRRLQQLPPAQLARLLGAGDVRRPAPRQTAHAGATDAVINRNWPLAAVARKNDALRSLRTPGTESPRPAAPCPPSQHETYNRSDRAMPGTRRWHPSPLASESRNPHRGWIRFRGPVRPTRPPKASMVSYANKSL